MVINKPGLKFSGMDAGARPFGTTLLIAGVDAAGPQLFATDPSGAFMEYKANSEGKGRSDAMAYFEEKYKENMTLEEAIDIGIKAIQKRSKGKLNPDAIEIAVVDAKEKGANAIIMVRFSTSEIMKGAAELLSYGTAVLIEDE